MRDWRKLLQSNAMRNVALGLVAMDTVGSFAVYHRIDQPIPLDSEASKFPRTAAFAQSDDEVGLPHLSKPSAEGKAVSAKSEKARLFVPLPAIEEAKLDLGELALDDAKAAETQVVAHNVRAGDVKVALVAAKLRERHPAATYHDAFAPLEAGTEPLLPDPNAAKAAGGIEPVQSSIPLPRPSFGRTQPTPVVSATTDPEVDRDIPPLSAPSEVLDGQAAGAAGQSLVPKPAEQAEPPAKMPGDANS